VNSEYPFITIHFSLFTIHPFTMSQTFHRTEHLKSEQIIAQLFKEGQSFACYPLRLVYVELPQHPLSKNTDSSDFDNPNTPPLAPIQVAFSVPKKNFKLATDRNRLRRRVREAYRLHKHELYNYLKNNALHADKNYAFMILYTNKEETTYHDIQKGIRKMIFRFKEALAIKN
jgi:ribonuclease P protein component